VCLSLRRLLCFTSVMIIAASRPIDAQPTAREAAESRVKSLRDSLATFDNRLKALGEIIAKEDSMLKIALSAADSATHAKVAETLRTQLESLTRQSLPIRTRLDDLGTLTNLVLSISEPKADSKAKFESDRKADEQRASEAARQSFQTLSVSWRQEFADKRAFATVAALLTLEARTGTIPPWLSNSLQWLGGIGGGVGLSSIASGSNARGDQRTTLLGIGAAMAGKLFEDKWISLRAGIEAITRSKSFRGDIDSLTSIYTRLAPEAQTLYDESKGIGTAMPNANSIERFDRVIAMQDTAFTYNESVRRQVEQLSFLSSGMSDDSRKRIQNAKDALDKSIQNWPSTKSAFVQTSSELRKYLSR